MRTMAGKKTTLLMSMLGIWALGMAIPEALAAPSDVPQKTFTLPAVKGYLLKAEVPNSLLILNSPPIAGSAAEARDKEASEDALRMGAGARWSQASADANLDFPNAVHAFDCVLGVEISATSTPKLYLLMQKSMLDLGLSTYPTKKAFQRARPFTVNNQPICTPEYETVLRQDGSYPSGHSAVGFGWGLMMANVAPEKSAELVKRGVEFGDSRRVCNVHWLSDVEDGRLMGAAVFARLISVPAFRKDLAAATKEYRHAVAAGRRPSRTCS